MALNQTGLLENVDSLIDSDEVNSTNLFGLTKDDIQIMIPDVMQGNWGNLSVPLSEWQKSQLANLEERGIKCLLSMWFLFVGNLTEGTYCNATWDNYYCWPPSPAGNATRQCSEVLKETEPFSHKLEGNALRVCLDNGTWQWGNWTNYDQCADSLEEYGRIKAEERELVRWVQYILFIGSLLSVMCLVAALSIFYYFRCLWCDRVKVHVNLMLALLLRFIMLIIITEPFIFRRTNHYRHVDIICKAVLSLHLYSTVASVNWMFLQGVYLNGKLTTNIFDRGTPFKVYYFVGWIVPAALIAIFAATLETYHPVKCWKDYSDREEMWILLGPVILALSANLLFLINILRILLTKVQGANTTSDSVQFRRAIKATFVLFPLLGINYLLLAYNPGGELNNVYVISNASFGSTQGIFVSILYCFLSKDVKDAIRREYQRFTARRGANSELQRQGRRGRGAPKDRNLQTPTIETKSKEVSGTQSPENINKVSVSLPESSYVT